ncbi:MAG: tetratricopeptide repeat protein [Acidobacteriota bacterium]
MRLIRVTLLISLLLATSSPARSLQETWADLYDRALIALEQHDYTTAVDLLKQAIRLNPTPVLQVNLGNFRYVDYLPYLNLGIAYYHLGNATEARAYLQKSEEKAVVLKSDVGKGVLLRYKMLLADAQAAARPATTPARKPGVLSTVEVDRLKDMVRQRCGLVRVSDTSVYPWYYHYELGMELAKKNDWQQALDALLIASDRKTQPGRLNRTYGMWYLDYLPYYHIGMAHYYLGNWQCAADALRLSETLDEVCPRDGEYAQMVRMRNESQEKAQGGPK